MGVLARFFFFCLFKFESLLLRWSDNLSGVYSCFLPKVCWDRIQHSPRSWIGLSGGYQIMDGGSLCCQTYTLSRAEHIKKCLMYTLVFMSVFHGIVGRKTEMKGEREGKRASCLYSVMTSLMHFEIQQFLFYSVRAFFNTTYGGQVFWEILHWSTSTHIQARSHILRAECD